MYVHIYRYMKIHTLSHTHVYTATGIRRRHDGTEQEGVDDEGGEQERRVPHLHLHTADGRGNERGHERPKETTREAMRGNERGYERPKETGLRDPYVLFYLASLVFYCVFVVAT